MSGQRMVVATAHFDGRPKRKPLQSFSATHQQQTVVDNHDEFLKQLHEERRKRDLERRREQTVYQIQALCRGHLYRKLFKNRLRHDYDVVKSQKLTPDLLETQITRLYLVFEPKNDKDRIIWLCQQVITNSSTWKISSLQIKRVLVTCIRYLLYAASAGSSTPITMPFRCLEVFLNMNEKTNVDLQLIKHLVENGYFDVMRALLDHHTPAHDLESEQLKPVTYSAESFMQAVLRPLQILKKFDVNDPQYDIANQVVWRSLVESFLARSPMTPIVRFYVLPTLANAIEALSLVSLARCCSSEDISALVNVAISCRTAEFSYSLAYLASKRLPTTFGNPQLSKEFTIVYAAAAEWLLDVNGQNQRTNAETDDSAEPMETDAHMVKNDNSITCFLQRCLFANKNSSWIMERWLEINHNKDFVSFITQVVNSIDSPSDPLLNAMVSLCRVHLCLEPSDGHQCGLLQALSCSSAFLSLLWSTLLTQTSPSIMGPPRPLLEQLQRGHALKPEDRKRLIPMLSVFCALFSTALAAANDNEFYTESNLKPEDSLVPFSLSVLASLSAVLRDIALGLIELALPDSRPVVSEQYREALTHMGIDFSPQDTSEWNQLFEVVVRLLQLLHDRDERLQFCPIGHWSVRNRVTLKHVKMFRSDHPNSRRRQYLFNLPRYLNRQDLTEESFVQSSGELRNMAILRKIPFIVPFEERVELFYQLVLFDQREHGRRGFWQEGIPITVRRNFLYEDSFDKLSKENAPDLTQLIRVTLKNWANVTEAGIDGGGLFREFLNELLKTAFDPQRGLFVSVGHDSAVYPNPMAPLLFPDGQFKRHYYFIGRMLAKLMYENQLTELYFSRFFLSRLLERTHDVDVHHLSYYDPVLYRSLLRIKAEKDVSLLNLDFSVMVEELGELKRYELKHGGNDIPVTNENRLEYIQLMADFYLNRRISEQTAAFRAGISDLIDLHWLQLFDYRELQVLIAGADRDIDVDDLRQHTVFSGDIQQDNGGDQYIEQFWRVVRSFSEERKRKLLKFVTSCSRPPLLGFKDLHPQFCVQLYTMRDGEKDRLPTAATCINLLKLPRFSDEATLRQKLLYAIESESGFELS